MSRVSLASGGVLFIALIASGCSTVDISDGKSAQAVMDISVVSSGYGEATNYASVDCGKSARPGFSSGPLKSLATFAFGRHGPVRITLPAGQSVKLLAKYNATASVSNGSVYINSCENYWTFMPEAGHSYVARARQCELRFMDESTHGVPVTYKRETQRSICPSGSEYAKSLADLSSDVIITR